MAGITSVITFPVQKINETDTIQLVMEFVISNIANGVDYNAKDIGLRVLNYGKLDLSYELEDAFLTPSKYTLVIGDARGHLNNFFFGSGDYTNYNKQALVTLKVNGVSKFIGRIVEDSIDYDYDRMIVRFNSAPQTDVLNKRMIYDEEDNALNPLGYSPTTYRMVRQILEDAYKLVNSSISYSNDSLEVIHDWNFQGLRTVNGCFINTIGFDEIYQLVDPLFFDTSFGLRTIGDMLRKLAVDWCSFTGMISHDKAFFKKLFHYNENNIQTVKVDGWKKGYRYGLIDYVKVSTNISGEGVYDEGVFTELEGRYLIRKALPGFWRGAGGTGGSNVRATISRLDVFVFNTGSTIGVVPDEGAVYSNNGSHFRVIGTPWIDGLTSRIATEKISGVFTPNASGTLTKVSGGGNATYDYTSWDNGNGEYLIGQSRDPNILNNSFRNHGDLMAKFWYKYRGNIQNCRVDKFLLRGINYDFLKDFNYKGSKFQPIGMTFDLASDVTECEAIYLGEV